MVKVTIFGNEYRVRGDADEAYIQEIAGYVDSTMREIAGEGRHISPTRIAILTAFNLADELFRTRQGVPAGGNKVENKAAELLKLFEDEEI